MRNASFLFHVTQDPWRSIIFLSPGPASNLGKGGRGEGGGRRGGEASELLSVEKNSGVDP